MNSNNTLNSLQAEVAKLLGRESVPVNVGLGELGLDSLKIVELILACDSIYSKDVDPETLEIDQFTSLEDLDRLLGDARGVAA